MKNLLPAVLLLTATVPASAQSQSAGGIPIRVGILTESVGTPSVGRAFQQLHPGLSMGTELAYGGRHRRWLQTLNVAAFHHGGLATSLLVTSEAGFRYSLGRLSADVKAGPGYVLNHSEASIYKATADGYEKTAGVEHRFAFTTSVSIGVRTGPVTPFVSYNAMVQTPFLSANSAFLPQQIFQLGLAARLGGKASK